MSDTSKREPVQLRRPLAHTEHLTELYGADNLFSFIGEIVAWPVLIFSDITLK